MGGGGGGRDVVLGVGGEGKDEEREEGGIVGIATDQPG